MVLRRGVRRPGGKAQERQRWRMSDRRLKRDRVLETPEVSARVASARVVVVVFTTRLRRIDLKLLADGWSLGLVIDRFGPRLPPLMEGWQNDLYKKGKEA